MKKEMIGEFTGKVIGTRVIAGECCPKIESTIQDMGKILDVDVTDIGTFWSMFREDGSVYGEGHGILMTNDGEIATWTGRGIGKMKGKAVEYIASVFFITSSKQLERLNNTMGIVKYSIDAEGNTQEKI